MKVLVKRPDERAVLQEMGHDLEDMRALIDGYVELYKVNEELYLLADEEGRLKQLPVNWVVDFDFGVRTVMVGPLVLAGRTPDGQMTDLPERYWNFFGSYRKE